MLTYKMIIVIISAWGGVHVETTTYRDAERCEKARADILEDVRRQRDANGAHRLHLITATCSQV